MLDDFTTITTWQNMGGTENPEENIYWSRCGSFKDVSRPDGYCARLAFDAVGREAEFGVGIIVSTSRHWMRMRSEFDYK